jgi:hypothetical protein
MNSYEAYKKYVAIKLHFQQEKYDYFKFNGVVKVSKDKFLTRKDKYFFDRICKLYDDKEYEFLLVANFLENENLWIGDILSDECRQKFQNWKKTQQSLDYTFKQDLNKINDILISYNLTFDDIFKIANNDNWPLIVNLAIKKEISLETFIIMNKVLNFMNTMGKNIEDEIIWPEFKRKCIKYSSFVQVDLNKYKKSMKNVFL